MKMCKTKTRIFGIVFSALLLFSSAYTLEADAADKEQVYVGGTPFGIRFEAGEVTVLKTKEFSSGGKTVSPAKEAGILENDIIKTINGNTISSLEDIVASVESASSDIMDITVLRGNTDVALKLRTCIDDATGKRQLGVMLKDSSAGIGTVTFISEDSTIFAGLGHGICDTQSGELINIASGYISEVEISGISKGKVGVPGELQGVISPQKCGRLLSNTDVGIYGVFSNYEAKNGDLIEIANKNDVSVGKAYILCTLDDNKREKYEIEIESVNLAEGTNTKNYVIRVTDKRLLGKTGGIVQGMSGSPIIQNDKLIGAVTHVLINDPTRGYGIFIENMLKNIY